MKNLLSVSREGAFLLALVLLLAACSGGGGGGGPTTGSLTADQDDDGIGDAADIDDDGDGLIELWTPEMLDNVRYMLDGTGYRGGEAAAINRSGCGDGADLTACSGYELMANISLASYSAGEGWMPIAPDTDLSSSDSCGESFAAVFDGKGYVVHNLTINRPTEDCVGLFGSVTGKIRNLGVQGESIVGNNAVGALVGDGANAAITSSSAEVGAVTGSSEVGGLVGNGFRATITSSSAAVGAVNGSSGVGGLVGDGRDAPITSSYAVVGAVTGSGGDVGGLVGNGFRVTITSSSAAVGAVNGSSGVGGLVGDGRDAPITSSYAVVGAVIGSGGNVGGLVGDGTSAPITSSYAVVGAVTGSGGNVGGLVGNGLLATITSSYWDSTVSGRTAGSYGEPQSTDELQTPTEHTDIYVSWDGACPDDAGEKIWDFGTATQYPAINCLPITPREQRSFYAVSGGDVTIILPEDLPSPPSPGNHALGTFTVNNISPAPRQSIRLSVTASCSGGSCAAATLVYYRSTDSRISTADIRVGTSALAVLSSGGSSPDFININAESTGTYFYGACIGNSCSNGVEVVITAPSGNHALGTFIVSDTSPAPRQSIQLSVTASCSGGSCAAATLVYYRSADSLISTTDTSVGTSALAVLSSGGNSREFININAEATGTYYYGACIGNSCTTGVGVTALSGDQDNDDVDDAADIDADGDGLIDIWTPAMLNNVRYVLNGTGYRDGGAAEINRSGCGGNAGNSTVCHGYELMRNISLTSYSAGEGWKPIANDTNPFANRCGESFTAVFDGNGYVVQDLTINRPAEECVGLFGSVTGEIRNLGVQGKSIVGNNRVGALVGYGYKATITSSYAAVDSVTGTEAVGGLVGGGVFGTITSSYSVVDAVSGMRIVGGLMGGGSSAITNSSAEVDLVMGSSSVGGLVGVVGGGVTIRSSYAKVDGSVIGSFNVGGLVGYGRSVTIRSSSAAVGSVTGDDEDVGGLVGYGRGAMITHSSAVVVGAVTGSSSVGGLVGDGEGATITNSSAAVVGAVTGSSFVGGLVGRGDDATITNSSAEVDDSVTGSANVGGLVGRGRFATITNSSAEVGYVSGRYVGGLVGDGGGAIITHSSAAVDLVRGSSFVGGLVGRGDDATITNSSAAVDDFVIGSGRYVGGLVGFGDSATIVNSSAEVDSVSGIRSVGGLVGNGTDATITSSYAVVGAVNGTSDEVGGLVGDGSSANITSSYAVVGVVGSSAEVGGLVGDGRFATITSSYAVVSDVTGSSDNVGGLVGDGSFANITSSYAAVNGSVAGSFNVGGLVGDDSSADIISSYAVVGAVTGSSSVGGLVGDGSSADIISSYAVVGAVTGSSDNVGGLVGDGSSATITSSYAVVGAVKGTTRNIGALVGDGGHATITFSYWDRIVEDNGFFNSAGVPQFMTDLQKLPENTDIYVNWDGACRNDPDEEIWDFGTTRQYPAINCLPITLREQRSFYVVSGRVVTVRLPEDFPF